MYESETLEFPRIFMEALAAQLPNEKSITSFVENFATAFSASPSEKYTSDFFFDIIKPALITLIRFKDDTAKELRYLQEFVAEKNCTNEGTDYAVEILESTLELIDDILFSYDVQPFRCDGEKFDPCRQNVVKKLTTDNPDLAKTVAESLSDGYERRGLIISKERVAAYSAQTITGESN